MLDKELLDQLKGYLERITEPIVLASSLDERPKSAEMKQMLDEIASCSDLVTHEQRDDNERRPSFAIERPGSDILVRFAGLPLGHEFTSLVLAMLQVGGVPVKADESVLEAAKAIQGEHEFVTYMSLTCQNCPTVVQALNALAVLNPNIKHTAVEGSLFTDEVEQRRILAVPTVYQNDEEFAAGRMDISDFVAKLSEGGISTEALSEKDPYEVLVLGGGPAGAAAAIYAARKGIRTGLAAPNVGGQTLDTMSIENFVSVPYTEGPKFAAGLEEHLGQYDIDLMKNVSATRLVPGVEGELHTVELEGGGTLRARTIVLATGARWRTLGVPGEQDYRNKGVSFCPHCDGPLFKGKPIAVVGGGNSGIEAAIDLAGVTEKVTLVEFLDELRCDDVLLKKFRSMPNTDIITGARTTEVTGDGSELQKLVYEDRASEQVRELEVNGVFVQIGLLPNTEWLRDSGLELSDRHEVVVDERGVTNLPGIFGAGDCTTVPFKQIIVAEGAGATAALSAFDHLIRTSAPDAPAQGEREAVNA
ncbi:alkyl hydroperoxide reductase subunit F [Naumannella sp. ID2617S]|nr:alkyl hydroperoxide reductase subunit F [Naumannella sp. ID2617S]